MSEPVSYTHLDVYKRQLLYDLSQGRDRRRAGNLHGVRQDVAPEQSGAVAVHAPSIRTFVPILAYADNRAISRGNIILPMRQI